MKKVILLVFGALLTFLLAGCGLGINVGSFRVVTGSGHVATESRAVSGFSAVELSGFGELTVTQGDSESLSIEAEDNFLPLILTEVRGNTLVIRIQQFTTMNPTKPIRYDVKLKNINALTLSGAGSVQSDGIKADRLNLTVSGAGNLDIKNAQAADLAVTSSGVGNIQLAGEITGQNVTLSGLGNYKAGDLKSKTARVNVSGAGNETLWASDSLDVNISGAGSVEYYGSPELTRKISGLGSVRSLGSK